MVNNNEVEQQSLKTISERSREWLADQPQQATRMPAQQGAYGGNHAKKPKVKVNNDFYYMDWTKELVPISEDMEPAARKEAVFRNGLLAIAQKTAKDFVGTEGKNFYNPRESEYDRHQRVKDLKAYIMSEFQANWDKLMAESEDHRFSWAKTSAIRDAINYNTKMYVFNEIPISRIYATKKPNGGSKTIPTYGFHVDWDYEAFQEREESTLPVTLADINDENQEANPQWTARYWELQQARLLADAIRQLDKPEQLAINMKYNSNWNEGEPLTLIELTEAINLYNSPKEPLTLKQVRGCLARGLKNIKAYVESCPEILSNKDKILTDLELEHMSLFMNVRSNKRANFPFSPE